MMINEEQPHSAKRRWPRVLLRAVAVILVLLSALAWWQRDNLKAVWMGVGTSREELEKQIEDNQQMVQEIMSQLPTIRPMTEEEQAALRAGEQDVDALAEALLHPVVTDATSPAEATPEEMLTQPTAPSAEKKPEQEPVPKLDGQETAGGKLPEAEPAKKRDAQKNAEFEQKLAAIMAKFYVLREEYLVKLQNMETTAAAEYYAIPSKNRTNSTLLKLGSKYISLATSLEKECDKKMDSLIAELKKLLRANQGDMSLIDTVSYTYSNEKSLKKAWYMAELKKRGLV